MRKVGLFLIVLAFCLTLVNAETPSIVITLQNESQLINYGYNSSGDILPTQDATWNVGSNLFKWLNGYFVNLFANRTTTNSLIAKNAVIGNSTGNMTIDNGDGSFMLYGTATQWDDIPVTITSAGSDNLAPALSDFKGGPIKLYTFSDAVGGSEDRVYASLQMSHSYKLGTDIDCHVHWTCGTTSTNNVTWSLWVSKADIGSNYSTPSVYTVTQQCGDAYKHNLADFHSIGNFTGISGIANFVFLRNSTQTSDTYTGNDAFAISLDCHYEKDSIGSREEYVK